LQYAAITGEAVGASLLLLLLYRPLKLVRMELVRLSVGLVPGVPMIAGSIAALLAELSPRTPMSQ